MCEPVLLRYVNGKYVRESDYIAPKRSRHFIDHSWTTTQDRTCGRFRLVAYAPYRNVSWSTHWQETGARSLRSQLPAIVRAMPGIALDLAERRREADRQWELQRAAMRAAEERRRRAEDKQNIRQSVKDSRDQLSQIIKAWGDVRNLELFFEGVAAAVSTLSSEARDVTLSRLALAREFVGSQNPLDFFLDWKTPLERYQPRYDDARSDVLAADEDE